MAGRLLNDWWVTGRLARYGKRVGLGSKRVGGFDHAFRVGFGVGRGVGRMRMVKLVSLPHLAMYSPASTEFTSA